MAKKDEKDAGKKAGNGHHYNAEDISVLEGLEPVRRRLGLYVGTTGPDALPPFAWAIFFHSFILFRHIINYIIAEIRCKC